MSETRTRRSGRPRTAVLTRELILRTALGLLDERGESGAGMRDIARKLGVGPSALYNHIDGHDDLIDGIRELVSDRIDVSGFGKLPWDEAVLRWARSYRSAFAAHPPTIALLAVRPLVPGSRTSRMYDAVCAGLIEGGWPVPEILPTIVALECFILGAAFDKVAPDDMLDPGDDPHVPTFAAAYVASGGSLRQGAGSGVRRGAAGGIRRTDVMFESGLAALLDGLRARLAGLSGK